MNEEIVAQLTRALEDDPLYKYLVKSECPKEVIFKIEVVEKIYSGMLYNYSDIAEIINVPAQKLRNTIHRNDMNEYIAIDEYGENKRPKFNYINVFKLWMHTLLVSEYNLTPQTIATIAGVGPVQVSTHNPVKYKSLKKDPIPEEYKKLKDDFDDFKQTSELRFKSLMLMQKIELNNVQLSLKREHKETLKISVIEKKNEHKNLEQQLVLLNEEKSGGVLKNLFGSNKTEKEKKSKLIDKMLEENLNIQRRLEEKIADVTKQINAIEDENEKNNEALNELNGGNKQLQRPEVESNIEQSVIIDAVEFKK